MVINKSNFSTRLCLKMQFCLIAGFEKLDAMIAAKMSKFVEGGRSSWRCMDCGKDYNSKADASRHVEAHHVNHPGLACNICLKILKNRESLRSHMTNVHKNLL